MSTTQTIQTNAMNTQFVSMQLSYSTADIEKSIFYTAEYTPLQINEPTGNTTLIVVHGEVFVLEESSIPQQSVPLTEEAGLFQIIGLDQQA